LRQFFLTIPADLEDAATIDGAHILQILWYVMLPVLLVFFLAQRLFIEGITFSGLKG
jgi:ABC-type glycerol-3-phosphate transport system permease component